MRVAAVIPTLDEEVAIAGVIAAIPGGSVDRVIVVDSGSADRTVERATAAGAQIINASRGYGRACLAGVEAAGDCDILVFLDGDGSDCPEEIPRLVEPIAAGRADFVIGSRSRGHREKSSMSAHQLVAGYAIGAAVRFLYAVSYSDMGPMRAIRRDALLRLGMREMTYGWNLDMQMRAARDGLRIVELPVVHRRRAGGVSKVSGNLAGTLKASWRIMLTFARVALEARRSLPATAPPSGSAAALQTPVSGGSERSGDENIDTVELHESMLRRISALEEVVANLSRPGIGHNQPPEPLEDGPLTAADYRVIAKAITVLRSQPPQPSEEPTEAIEAAHALQSASAKVSAYLSQKADLFVTEAVKAAGSETGKWPVRAAWAGLAFAMAAASTATLAWLHSLTWSLH